MPIARETTQNSAPPANVPATESGRTPAAGATRDDSLDIAKGFGIILVVLGHCLDGLVASAFFPATLPWPVLAIETIYAFHMPLFFVISGHLASGKHRAPGVTISRLLPTIVYPYFLWSIVQGLVQVYLTKYTTSHVPLSSLYKILWIPIIPYWFLYALFCCHLGYLVIRKLAYPVQFCIAAALFVAPVFFMPAIASAHLLIIPQVVFGFFYFILGVISVAQVKRLGLVSAIVATLVFIGWMVTFRLLHLGGAFGTILLIPAATAGIVATLAWSRQLARLRGPLTVRLAGLLAFLGRYSMSIYVLHIFFTAGVRILLKRLGTHDTLAGTVLELTAATVLGLLIPLGINWMISKARADRWFGLQHMEAAR